MRFGHVNIISRSWRELASFYQDVLQCEPVPPQRKLAGDWLAAGTGVPGASLRGMHLRLPGHGPAGPTLEIYEYDEVLAAAGAPAANRQGLAHLAFAVDDVKQTLAQIIARGGKALGQVVHREIPGAGRITFVYATDPEGNIIELQRWL